MAFRYISKYLKRIYSFCSDVLFHCLSHGSKRGLNLKPFVGQIPDFTGSEIDGMDNGIPPLPTHAGAVSANQLFRLQHDFHHSGHEIILLCFRYFRAMIAF